MDAPIRTRHMPPSRCYLQHSDALDDDADDNEKFWHWDYSLSASASRSVKTAVYDACFMAYHFT